MRCAPTNDFPVPARKKKEYVIFDWLLALLEDLLNTLHYHVATLTMTGYNHVNKALAATVNQGSILGRVNPTDSCFA